MASDSPAVPSSQTLSHLPYHYSSASYAPSAQAITIMCAFCLGIVLYDSCVHFRFDVHLLRSPGWRRPIKVINRLAYFAIRTLLITFLVMMMCFLNVKFDGDCSSYFRAIFVISYLVVALIDIIFLTRTLALYNWHKPLSVALLCLYCSYVGIALSGVSHWGHAYRPESSPFCTCETQKPKSNEGEPPFLSFFALSTFFDIVILVLTCKRLATQDGGVVLHGLSTSKLSRTLIVQGFVLYGCFSALKLIYILFHYLTDYKQLWTLFGVTIGITGTYMTASTLIRQTSHVIQNQATTMSNNSSRNNAISSGNDFSARPISIKIEKEVVEKVEIGDGGESGYVFAPTLPR